MLFQTSEHFILMENPNSAAINSVTGQVIPYTESHENLPNSGNRNRYLDAVSGEKPYSPEPITPYQPFNMGGQGYGTIH